MVHTCYPSTWEGDQEYHGLRSASGDKKLARPLISINKLGMVMHACYLMPVVPATQEAIGRKITV
jgi:hypothetical protein